MLQLTKIFHFEMAHAIHGYSGACKDIHGHSYELHVTVSLTEESKGYIPPPGFIFDFKELKRVTTESVIKRLDHKLVLSNDYLAKHPGIVRQENLVNWEAEPTAENLLIYMQHTIAEELPPFIKLAGLKLYETADSYASWIDTAPGKE
ncbi:MAG: 6-carboxytetrahydropterin synthase [Bacteroidota bacterium]|nr:6-carboxytetrahydropterin synthase [Bacteroidota bacterium]